MHKVWLSEWISDTYSSHFDEFREQIKKMADAGEGYLWLSELVTNDTGSSGRTQGVISRACAKVVSVTVPEKRLFGVKPAEVTVKLTDGSVVPLFDKNRMKNHSGYGKTGSYAWPSAEIRRELERYRLGFSVTSDYTLSYTAMFFPEDDQTDMITLHELIKSEDRRRSETADRMAAKQEDAGSAQASEEEERRKAEELRKKAAQALAEMRKRFGE